MRLAFWSGHAYIVMHREAQTGLPAKNQVFKTTMEEYIMKTWTKPEVREQEVGLEVTSYLPAEIDLI